MREEENSYTEEESTALFKEIFPEGISSEVVKRALVPMGYKNSPLLHLFHPTLQQAYEDSKRMHENLKHLDKILAKKKGKQPEEKQHPSLEEFSLSYEETEVNEKEEWLELMGDCFWDIFSNNHEVKRNGCWFDIGSFRGSAHFIADRVNEELGTEYFNYMDFYMGTCMYEHRENLQPVYEFIFQRLKILNCDWEYSFPRMGLVNFNNAEEEKDSHENYSPTESIQKEIEQNEKQKSIDDFQEKLDEIYESELEEAKYKAPPKTVQAYFSVFKKYPAGWIQ